MPSEYLWTPESAIDSADQILWFAGDDPTWTTNDAPNRIDTLTDKFHGDVWTQPNLNAQPSVNVSSKNGLNVFTFDSSLNQDMEGPAETIARYNDAVNDSGVSVFVALDTSTHAGTTVALGTTSAGLANEHQYGNASSGALARLWYRNNPQTINESESAFAGPSLQRYFGAPLGEDLEVGVYGTTSTGPTVTNINDAENMWFGSVGNQQADGDIYEIIAIKGNVPEGLRQKIEGYLAWKWGIQDSLVVGHPYSGCPPLTVDLWSPADLPDADTAIYSWLNRYEGNKITDNAGNASSIEQQLSSSTAGDYSQGTAASQPAIEADNLHFQSDNMVATNTIGVVTEGAQFLVGEYPGGASQDIPWGSPTTNRMYLAASPADDYSMGAANANWAVARSDVLITDRPVAIHSALYPSDLLAEIWVDGVEENKIVSNTGSYGDAVHALGSSGTGTFPVADFKFWEGLTLTRLPTTDERQDIEGYLAWKRYVTFDDSRLIDGLQPDHPYKNTPPTSGGVGMIRERALGDGGVYGMHRTDRAITP